MFAFTLTRRLAFKFVFELILTVQAVVPAKPNKANKIGYDKFLLISIIPTYRQLLLILDLIKTQITC